MAGPASVRLAPRRRWIRPRDGRRRREALKAVTASVRRHQRASRRSPGTYERAPTATAAVKRRPEQSVTGAGGEDQSRGADREESVLRRERLIVLAKAHTACVVLLQKGIGREQSLLGGAGSGQHAQRVGGVFKIAAGTAGRTHIVLDARLSESGQHSPQFLLRRNDHGDTSPCSAPPAGTASHTAADRPHPRADTTASHRAPQAAFKCPAPASPCHPTAVLRPLTANAVTLTHLPAAQEEQGDVVRTGGVGGRRGGGGRPPGHRAAGRRSG